MFLPNLSNTGPNIVAKDLCTGLVRKGHVCQVFYFDDIVELDMPCSIERITNMKRFDFSNESKEKNEIFDKRDLMTKDKDWNGLESTEGAIYNNEAKIQLKAGMYLENMGVHKKGSTVDMLVEKGWDKEHLNNLSKNISNVINKADNKRISDINIFSLKLYLSLQ